MSHGDNLYVCLYKYSTLTICESPCKFWLFWYNLKEIPMASWKMLCFVFLFTSFFICHDARPLPSSQLTRSNENYAFIESYKHVLKEIIRRKQLLGTKYNTNRLSPGGPDPHHHWSSTLVEGCGENSKTKKHDQDSRTLNICKSRVTLFSRMLHLTTFYRRIWLNGHSFVLGLR